MRTKIAVIALLILVATCSTSVGYYMGYGGNMGTYPTFYEMKPSKPYNFGTTVDQYAQDRYKKNAEEYIEHGKQYIDNCDSDIQKIQNARSDAVSDINSFIKEYNSYIRSLN